MFFRKKKTPKLVDIVPKVTHTDYVFNNIMGDLGHACDDINRSTPLMVMAYAYARRTAAAAMYIQGLYDRDAFAYVQSMFVNFQKNTDGSVEFQEAAAVESYDFMQTYSTQINGLLTKGLIMIARDYDVSGNRLDDADLFKEVIDTLHNAQKEVASASAARDSHASSMRAIESALKSFWQTESTQKAREDQEIQELISRLQELSSRDTLKTVTVSVMPLEESWECEFDFSDEEWNIADELMNQISDLMAGKVVMSSLKYHPKDQAKEPTAPKDLLF